LFSCNPVFSPYLVCWVRIVSFKMSGQIKLAFENFATNIAAFLRVRMHSLIM
jgi:hypothetical protein